MGIFKYGILYNIRKHITTGIMVIILTLIFFCELVGLCLYSVSEQGKEQAFVYNGKALSVGGVSVNEKILKQMELIEHITNVDKYDWYSVKPVGYHSAKDYDGDAAINTEQYSDEMCMVTHRDVRADDWFRSEKAVSLYEGTYPTKENRGILIEKRFAKANNQSVGDDLTFSILIEEDGKESKEEKCDFSICGIYEADTPFIIYDSEEIADRIFSWSPYNRVYANCEYVAEQLGIDIFQDSSWNIYTDSYASVPKVTEELRVLLGEEAVIYNNADSYLEASTGVVVVMNHLSKVILVYTSVIGAIVLLIVMTFFHEQYRHEVGILIALGYGRAKIILMYLWNMLIKIIMALVLSIGLYCAVSGTFVNIVDGHIIETFAETVNSGSGPYETTNLENGFSLAVDAYQIFNGENSIRLFMILAVCLFLCVLIPVSAVCTTKAGTVLNE